MERVCDNFGSLICLANAATGQVEECYKDFSVSMIVQVGDAFTVKRGNKVTVVTRTLEGFTAVSVKAA